MIGNRVFGKPHHAYENKLDRLFVWMVDEMKMGEWYDAKEYWDLVLQIYNANCYNSGVYISLDDKKRWKKIGEETISKKEFELRNKIKHEEYLESID